MILAMAPMNIAASFLRAKRKASCALSIHRNVPPNDPWIPRKLFDSTAPGLRGSARSINHADSSTIVDVFICRDMVDHHAVALGTLQHVACASFYNSDNTIQWT
jgi:hypothetical protein